MSSEEPIRSVPDELFRKVSARPERQLPDALFGGPPPASREPEAAPAEASGAAGESGGGSDSGEDSDAEDDGSGDIVTGVRPQVHVGGDTSPVGTTNDISVADGSVAAVEETVATGTDRSAVAPGESVAPVADGSVAEVVESVAPVADRSAVAPSESVAPAVDGSVAELGESVASAAEEFAADAIAESVATGVDRFAAVSGESVAADAVSASPAPTDTVIESAPTGSTVTGEAGLGSDESAPAVADKPVESREATRPVLLVIADSLAYFGPKGGLPADHPRIWPNLVGAELDWDVELVARIGWTCRDAYWALIGDPRVWAAVPRAGAVVFAVGGMDTLPSPLPTALRELIRYVRPPAVRRVVRATYNWLQPKLSKLGRPVALPPKVSVDYLEQCRTALAQLRPDLPVVAVLPSVHDCAAYGRVHSGRPPAVEALRAWSGRTSVPLVDLGEAVRDNIFSGEANPDGIHWGWDGHTAVANAMVKTLQEVR